MESAPFTFQNVWERRAEFEAACKKARACAPQYRRLKSVKTEKGFMRVIEDNTIWIHSKLEDYEWEIPDNKDSIHGLIRVRRCQRVGLKRYDGTYLLEPQYNYIHSFNEGLARFEDDNKYGFLNPHGQIVIKPKYEYAGDFSEGLALIRIDHRYGYIDADDNIIIEPQFDDFCEDFQDGFACVRSGGKFGYIRPNGDYLFKPEFGCAFSFKGGIASARKGEKWYKLNTKGEVVDFSICRIEALNELQDSFIPKGTKTIAPFSNGSSACSWRSANCERCPQYESESTKEEDAGCRLAFYMDIAFITGEIPLSVAQEIGLYDNRIVNQCSKFGEKPTIQTKIENQIELFEIGVKK